MNKILRALMLFLASFAIDAMEKESFEIEILDKNPNQLSCSSCSVSDILPLSPPLNQNTVEQPDDLSWEDFLPKSPLDDLRLSNSYDPFTNLVGQPEQTEDNSLVSSQTLKNFSSHDAIKNNISNNNDAQHKREIKWCNSYPQILRQIRKDKKKYASKLKNLVAAGRLTSKNCCKKRIPQIDGGFPPEQYQPSCADSDHACSASIKDRTKMAFIEKNGQIKIRFGDREMAIYLPNKATVKNLHFSPDGNFLAIASHRALHIVRFAPSIETFAIPTNHFAEELLFSYDNTLIAYVDSASPLDPDSILEDRLVRLWDITRKKLVRTWIGARFCNSIAGFIDGIARFKIYKDDGSEIWDIFANKCVSYPLDY